MDRSTERRDELVGAALAGELTPDERAELDAWCADDPALAREVAELGELAGDLRGSGLTWTEAAPTPDLEARVVDATRRRPPRRVALLAAAAVLVAGGAAGALGIERVVDQPAATPTGPPGTLGAVEHVAATTELPGAKVDLSLVPHTWGTETVMHLDGFEVGERYDVVLLDREGREVESGSFLGSAVHIDCRLNVALLREEVTGLEIVEPDGTVVVSASVPSVDA